MVDKEIKQVTKEKEITVPVTVIKFRYDIAGTVFHSYTLRAAIETYHIESKGLTPGEAMRGLAKELDAALIGIASQAWPGVLPEPKPESESESECSPYEDGSCPVCGHCTCEVGQEGMPLISSMRRTKCALHSQHSQHAHRRKRR